MFEIQRLLLQICRDECEVLEYDVCAKELMLVNAQPMINHQLVLPVCTELPRINTPEAYNCVRLGIPRVNDQQLVKPMMCYNGDRGEDYRGTVSVTKSGLTCKPWHLNFTKGREEEEKGAGFEKQPALMGGHNYCRNPTGSEQEEEPWCYTNDPM